MADIEARLEELGINLPEQAPPPIANYVPSVRVGNLIFLSGLGPAAREDGATPSGKVGRDLTQDEGYEAARLTGINILARMRGRGGRPGQREARGQDARHGEQRPRLQPAARRHKRLLRPVRRGVRRRRTPRPLSRRHGIPPQ